jgi:hypothetical protein
MFRVSRRTERQWSVKLTLVQAAGKDRRIEDMPKKSKTGEKLTRLKAAAKVAES